MMMDRPSLAIHPRLAKSINALFTVSREDPTAAPAPPGSDRAAPSGPASTGSPNRDARLSSVLASRPGTSMNTRSQMRSLLLRMRCAIPAACPRPRADVRRASRTARHVPARPHACRWSSPPPKRYAVRHADRTPEFRPALRPTRGCSAAHTAVGRLSASV